MRRIAPQIRDVGPGSARLDEGVARGIAAGSIADKPPPAACRDQAAGHNGGAETLTDRGACEACPRGNGAGHLAPADRAQREDSRLRRFEYSDGGLVLEQ